MFFYRVLLIFVDILSLVHAVYAH